MAAKSKWIYVVWDIRTGKKVGKDFTTRTAAQRNANARDKKIKYHRYAVDYEERISNPSILKKFKKGVRGTIKLSRGRLIIKT